jgi:hypothetical protein
MPTEAEAESEKKLAARVETKATHDDELAGLNGSAEPMLDDIVKWMGSNAEHGG